MTDSSDIVERLMSYAVRDPMRDEAADEITALRARLAEVEKERDQLAKRVQDSIDIHNRKAWEAAARAERAEAALLGPIKPITQDDMANIIAHLSPDLEPAGPLPNRNSVMMALIEVKNAHKAALATARRDAYERAAQVAETAKAVCARCNSPEDNHPYRHPFVPVVMINIPDAIRALANEAET